MSEEVVESTRPGAGFTSWRWYIGILLTVIGVGVLRILVQLDHAAALAQTAVTGNSVLTTRVDGHDRQLWRLEEFLFPRNTIGKP